METDGVDMRCPRRRSVGLFRQEVHRHRLRCRIGAVLGVDCHFHFCESDETESLKQSEKELQLWKYFHAALEFGSIGNKDLCLLLQGTIHVKVKTKVTLRCHATSIPT